MCITAYCMFASSNVVSLNGDPSPAAQLLHDIIVLFLLKVNRYLTAGHEPVTGRLVASLHGQAVETIRFRAGSLGV